ncbi:MAG: Na/Pi symporter [Bacteroidales bacterium]|nr:Na/Pi symporter [Bacteroidales bacterium]MDY6002502.1 Na/Pi symporter [Candidatus Cryptobacteroides sp.]
MILQILTLLGAIALFIFGMDMLSSELQKLCGDKLRKFEKGMRSGSAVSQFLSGAGMTALIQSSSITSYVVVTLVSGATLTLEQGIAVIMGANVGTTITPWLIGILGFNLNISYFAFILVCIGFVMSLMKNQTVKNLGNILLSFALLFVGLIFMNSSLKALTTMPGTVPIIDSLGGHGFWSIITFLLLSILFTWLIRSSSVTVIISMVLCFAGWLSFPLGAAIVLGANIGTTIHPNIAVGRADVQGRRAALAHTIFNVVGCILVLIFFNPFINLCTWLISLLNVNPQISEVYEIATVHTLFNLFSAIILIWFRKIIAGILRKIFKEPTEQRGEFRLRFIGNGRLSVTPSISIELALKEALNFAETAHDGYQYVKLALNERNPDIFEEYREKLVKSEEITDKFEYEIASYLNQLSEGPLSGQEADEVKKLYRIIGELESLGDSCMNISRHLYRLRAHNLEFDAESLKNLNLLVNKVEFAYNVMIMNIHLAVDKSLTDISNAGAAEDDINDTRNMLRDECINRIERESEKFLALNYYLDLLEELETMGDFMINVSQSLVNNFSRK